MSTTIVSKFGGKSLADAGQFRKVAQIVRADPGRKCIVVSAPAQDDHKVTDLLIGLQRGMKGLTQKQILDLLAERFYGIVEELRLNFDTKKFMHGIELSAPRPGRFEYLVSRGEYFSANVLAELLEFTFVDALHVVKFDASGRLDMQATRAQKGRLLKETGGCVIPGFYGANEKGVKLLSRGGSDLSGAIVASLVGADLCEIWTDVSGLLTADPTVVPNAQTIDTATFKEVRELSFNGARVLHDEALMPLRAQGIAINIRNTNHPNDAGTMIVPDERAPQKQPGVLTGIAGRKDFTDIRIEKMFMPPGYASGILQILAHNGVDFDRITDTTDSMSVVIASEKLGKLEIIKAQIQKELEPDTIRVHTGLSLICFVGRAMFHTPGVAAKILQAVAAADISVGIIDQTSSEMSITLGVKNDDYERTVSAVHGAFFPA
jgi:aspartate kinase